jgi:Arm DNA-binding domain
VPLTDTLIRALKPRQSRYLVTDGRGLCLEVLPSGKFSWLFRYRINGRPEKVSLGRYPDLSLKSARCERDKQATLLAGGRSPAEEKRLAKLALTRDCTVREFSERYYHDIVLRDRKDPSDMLRYLDNEILPILGPKPLSQVTAADVQTLVFRKRDNGKESAAAQIRSLMKRIFDYAVVCGVAQTNPAMALPTRFITKVRSRTRALVNSGFWLVVNRMTVLPDLLVKEMLLKLTSN